MSLINMFFLSFFITFLSSSALAGYLIQNAKIVKIGSSNWNEKVFYIDTLGGVGPCVDKTIDFPEEYSQSTVAYAQSHSMAMSAYIHDELISVYNYSDRKYKNDDVCTGANRITLIK